MEPAGMMKKEFCVKFGKTLCYACLSSGRELKVLGEFARVFRQICSSVARDTDDIHLCWECRMLLRKVESFQRKVLYAQHIMECQDHRNLSRSLSNLSCVQHIIQESYPKLENVENKHNPDLQHIENEHKYDVPLDVKIIIPQIPIKVENNIDYNEDFDDHYDYDYEVKDENLPDPILKELNEITVKKVKVNKARHPTKRTRHYKMTLLKVNKVVRRIPIEQKDVAYWLQQERNSTYFKELKNKCDKCVSKIQTNLREHNRKFHMQTKSKKLYCTICEQFLSTEQALKQHVQEHCSYYSCDLCGYSCYNKHHVARHLHHHAKTVQCLDCEANFFNTREFFEHYRLLHTEFVCDHCGKRCKAKQTLLRHLHRQHETHRCSVCQLVFVSYRSYREHVKLKHRIERSEASYCVQCDLQFDTVPLYRRHVHTSVAHSAERRPKKKKSFKCLSCSNVYGKKYTMMNHYKKVHMNKPRFYCADCNKGFLNSTRYKDHLRYKHEGHERERNSVCNICGRGFYTKRILENHLRTHTGERPFPCALCPARFAQKVALASHVKFIHLKSRRGQAPTSDQPEQTAMQ